jgi:hypothetical protein
MIVLLALVPFAALGFVVGRFSVIVVPPLACCVYFVGLGSGWWGSGLGDGWPFALAALSLAGVLAVAAGVGVRRRASRTRRRFL